MKLIGTYKRFTILHVTEHDRKFYGDMGRFFCNKTILDELEGPIYDDKDHEWLLVKDGLQVIAFASWTRKQHPTIVFGVLWVHPQYRRQGIARELFTHRTVLCQAQGATRLVALANHHSCNLHLTDGWRMTSQRGPRWARFVKNLS